MTGMTLFKLCQRKGGTGALGLSPRQALPVGVAYCALLSHPEGRTFGQA